MEKTNKHSEIMTPVRTLHAKPVVADICKHRLYKQGSVRAACNRFIENVRSNSDFHAECAQTARHFAIPRSLEQTNGQWVAEQFAFRSFDRSHDHHHQCGDSDDQEKRNANQDEYQNRCGE